MAMFGDLDSGTALYIAAWLAFLAIVLPSVFFAYRGRFGTAAKHAAVWIAILLALVSGYAYRDEVSTIAARVSAELAPAGTAVTTATPDGARAVRIRRSSHGPFVARAKVNGAETMMLVDTGASSVVLKAADAERAGIDLSSLKFTVAVETANGSTFCAPIRLRQIDIGGITYQGVEALVSKPGNLKESLLGMSFLRRLRSYDFSGDFLTLRS
ncbi:MAG: TIGR02281 family clan AA aspartic protease [Hyphomicrobiaceae bacterium]